MIWRYFRDNSATRSAYFQLFLICLFPIQVFALVNLFYSMSSLVLEMTLWQIIGVTAYVFSFALFESLLVFGLLFLLSLAVPRRFFGARLIANGTALILAGSIATALNHLHFLWKISSGDLRYWTIGWTAFGVAAALLMIWGTRRSQRMEKILLSGAERLALVSVLYFSCDVAGILIIVSRNLL